MATTMFERYGGFASSRRVVSSLYDLTLDSYSQMVERNTRDLQREKERVEKLLLNIMPRSVFDEMTEVGTVTPPLKTIGDAYLAVAGLPDPSPDHAHDAARVALRIKRYLERRNASHPEHWLCRIGVNTGPVIGSIVGVQKYVDDIFGPGVNVAARMESLADPTGIVMSEATYDLIRNDFDVNDLGEVDIKGFGSQHVFSLDGEAPRR